MLIKSNRELLLLCNVDIASSMNEKKSALSFAPFEPFVRHPIHESHLRPRNWLPVLEDRPSDDFAARRTGQAARVPVEIRRVHWQQVPVRKRPDKTCGDAVWALHRRQRVDYRRQGGIVWSWFLEHWQDNFFNQKIVIGSNCNNGHSLKRMSKSESTQVLGYEL